MRRASTRHAEHSLFEATHGGDVACWPALEIETGSVLILGEDWEGHDGARTEWWRSYVGADRAEMLFEWMSARPGEWPLWGRLAILFGEMALRSLILAAAEREAEEAALAAERARLEEEDRTRRHRQIDLFILDEKRKRPGLSLQSGDERRPFFVMRFSEKWERERVLDWLRWERPRFAEFRDLCGSQGSVALERLIIAGMRETEARIKAAGLASGGRRPLRFWRGEP